MNITSCISAIALVFAVVGCRPETTAQNEQMTHYDTMGSVERLSPEFDSVIAPGVRPQLLASGFDWSEGPIWVADGSFLVFSDVPQNKAYRWNEGDTVASVFLDPSGHTSQVAWTGNGGSNGLALDREGYLVLAQHGDRRVARLDQKPASLQSTDEASFSTIVDRYEGSRLNSPNDVVFGPNGDLYFTDPPYGLPDDDNSTLREVGHNGVYRVATRSQDDGAVHLLDDQLSRPNGLAFSPDGQTMYVSNSDPQRAIWMAYDVMADGNVQNGRVFFDATAMVTSAPGLPDGMKVDKEGHLFATGPGGVLILTPDGRHLGTIGTGTAIANCAFGDDGKSLYMTADGYLVRIRVLTGA